MLLGNVTNGVSLGLLNLMQSMTTQTRQVEAMLSLGATRWEATKTYVHQAIITAMTPTLNQMAIVGIVSIPGMMTGQILGGQSPLHAARYQAGILSSLGLLLAASSCTSPITDLPAAPPLPLTAKPRIHFVPNSCSSSLPCSSHPAAPFIVSHCFQVFTLAICLI